MNKNVIIIGNGISGITAARHIRKLSKNSITIISDETKYFYSRTALMYIYMGHMKFEHTKPYEDWFWSKNKIKLIQNRVTKIDDANNKVELANGDILVYDELILALGSKPNMLNWPGVKLKAVQGLYHLKDLESMEQYSSSIKRAVIVGGGLIGIEMAEMFLSRNIEVTFLVRETSFWNNVLPKEESFMVSNLINEHHIDLKLETELTEILGDENGRVKAVTTNKGEEISCEFVGITMGVSPNIDFLKTTNIETDRGILVDQYLRTNINNIYAIGDSTQQRLPLENRRPFEQIWYTGRIMGKTVAQTICKGETAYKPGIWFNSAKFFDLEYQTYGWVFNKLNEDEEGFYWEDKEKKIALRFIYSKNSGEIRGFNSLGIRLRHKVCEKWIEDKKHIDYVIEHISLANFDPEFFRLYENDLLQQYNTEKEKELSLKSKRKLLSWFAS